MRKFLEIINTLDRRWIFVFIGLAVSLPLFFPIGIKFSVSHPVQGFYDTIEKIPDGSKILMSCDFDPGSMPELYPMTITALEQMFRKDLKVIITCLWPAGPPLVERALAHVGAEYNKQKGIDYVHLGFKEGKEVVMVSMGASIPNTFPTDYHGTPVSEIPIMQGVTNYREVAMIVNISAGYPGTKEWVQQVQSRYQIGLVAGCTAVSAPEFYPYYQTGQLKGLMGGMKGAAEYEKLVGVMGLGTRGMDAQSVSHLMVFAFILIGNLAYFTLKFMKRKESG
ncbi:MAG: hypothetical protein A2142_04390 [candidate division Zixibacteria bacterium RBG_16_48_11]|nr:MAG: hypothetical protein A2142_04390 [candidate division Zixibacteria bacterium RBG_16_48_11]